MIILRRPGVRLSVDPAFGCRWMRLEVKIQGRWTDVLVPANARRLRRDPLFDGAYLMAPWCNRIPHARFSFGGKVRRLRSNFVDGSAIHGDAWGRPWRVRRRSTSGFAAELDARRFSDFNFPWPVVVRHGARLTRSGVSGWLTLRNVGDRPCPAGLGFHPFLKRAGDARIEIAAGRRFPSRHAVPTGAARAVAGGRTNVDLSRGELDAGFTAITGPMSLWTRGLRVTLAPGAGAGHAFVWAPRRFRGRAATFLCAEPMTMGVDGFRRRARGARDTGVAVLKPGESLTLRWRLEARAG